MHCKPRQPLRFHCSLRCFPWNGRQCGMGILMQRNDLAVFANPSTTIPPACTKMTRMLSKEVLLALESASRQCLFIGFSSCEAVQHSMEPPPERREGCSLKMRTCQNQRQFVLKIVDLEARFFATEPNLGSSAGTMAGLPTFLEHIFF